MLGRADLADVSAIRRDASVARSMTEYTLRSAVAASDMSAVV
jgi:hypothetical protein